MTFEKIYYEKKTKVNNDTEFSILWSSEKSRLAEALDAAVSAAVGKPSSPPVTSAIPISISNSYNTSHMAESRITKPVNGGSDFTLQQVSDDVLSFNSDSQAYLDKGLTSGKS